MTKKKEQIEEVTETPVEGAEETVKEAPKAEEKPVEAPKAEPKKGNYRAKEDFINF